MSNGLARAGSAKRGLGRLMAKIVAGGGALILSLMAAGAARAQESAGGEANLKLPDLSQVQFLGRGWPQIAAVGDPVSAFSDCAFGMTIYVRLKNLPVHRSMREISELIYETCKTYLINAGQIPVAAVGVHRGGDRAVLRRAAANTKRFAW